jgi:hypothetical protein
MRYMEANMDAFFWPVFIFSLVLVLIASVFITVKTTNWLNASMNRARENAEPILSGQVALIFKEGRCIRIVDDGVDYQLANGETRVPLSLQDRGAPLEPHTCYTADRAKVRLSAYAIWSVGNVRDLLKSASLSEESLRVTVQMAVQPALAEAVAAYKLEDLTGRMSEIARHTQKEGAEWLKRYGLALHRVSITQVQLPEPTPAGKPEGQKEAERLTTLNGIVPKVDEKTLHYAKQMRELELANARESRAEKKA